MRISIDEARKRAVEALGGIGYAPPQAGAIADHLLDCELRGLPFSGLARVISIAERVAERGLGGEMRLVRQTPISAQIDGGDAIGYLVAGMASDIVREKAKQAGMAIVGANRTWYTGMLSFYAEKITEAGLVAIIASNTAPWVAPQGGTEAVFGTNPLCVGFPSAGQPVIWDIGTSNIIHAQAILAQRRGEPLAPGLAFDRAGAPTTDPAAALAGAFTPWGGHKGAGLGLVVQMLGMLAGSPASPEGLGDFGFLVIAIDPALLGSLDDFKARIARYAESVRASRPADPANPVRMPFDRSRADRRERLARGALDIPDPILETLTQLARRA